MKIGQVPLKQMKHGRASDCRLCRHGSHSWKTSNGIPPRRSATAKDSVGRRIEECDTDGEYVRTAGCVIARQRPGMAMGFIFLSMEDETGIANVIVTPDLYERERNLL